MPERVAGRIRNVVGPFGSLPQRLGAIRAHQAAFGQQIGLAARTLVPEPPVQRLTLRGALHDSDPRSLHDDDYT